MSEENVVPHQAADKVRGIPTPPRTLISVSGETKLIIFFKVRIKIYDPNMIDDRAQKIQTIQYFYRE